MARRKSRTLTEVELEFMQILWSGREFTTEQILGALRLTGRNLADGSVRKVLSILAAKGYVSRCPQGKGFLYRAEVAREEARRSMARDLLSRAFDGSAALMVATLFDRRDVRSSEVRRIKELIARYEKEGRK